MVFLERNEKMIYSTHVERQTIEQGRNARFNNDEVRTKSSRCPYHGWLIHDEHSDSFSLIKPGIYRVSFNANISSAQTGEISLKLLVNGKEVKGSKAMANIVEENKYSNVSGEVLIRVNGCKPIELVLNNDECQYFEVTDLGLLITKVA